MNARGNFKMNNEIRQLLERCLARAKLSIYPLDAKLAKDIEAALVKPVQEPAAWLTPEGLTTFGYVKSVGFIDRRDRAIPDSWQPLYTSPQVREHPPLVQIASDIMGAVVGGDLSDQWEGVADLLTSPGPSKNTMELENKK
jgi:hypothetical protein